MKDWASTVVPNKILHIHSEPRPVTQHSGFKYKLFCTSCAQCQKQLAQYRTKGEPAPDNGWNAIVEYNPETQMLTKEWAPLEMHGDFALTRIWSQLTSTAEEALRGHLEKGRCTAVELLEIAVQHQDVIPDTEFIQGFMSNYRQKHSKGEKLAGKHRWCEADWRTVERKYPAFDSVARDVPDRLVVVSMTLVEGHTCVVVCNPALVQEVLSRLANPAYVKLCGDWDV